MDKESSLLKQQQQTLRETKQKYYKKICNLDIK